MKWFKHITDSLEDPFIYDLVKKHGPFGYLFFFGILEIYAREFKIQEGWKLDVSLHYIRDKLCLERTTRIKYCLANVKLRSKWRILVYGQRRKERVTIYIPKFLTLLDEHTRNKLRKYEKDSGVTQESLRSKEEEEEEDKDNRPRSSTSRPNRVKKPTLEQVAKDIKDEFEYWWVTWPKKVKKQAALKAYAKGRRDNDMPEIKELVDITHKHVAIYEERDDPQFIPHPATWLNAQQWNDELEGDDAFDRLLQRHETNDDLVQETA